ncbi:MAG: TauD/TfdA dioxygenase family protein [Burkholderiaceae bacterium]
MALKPQVLRPLQLIDTAQRYRHIKVEPRMPNFAAWIHGVDLRAALPEPVRRELRQALWDFEVIFFPPQQITSEQHIALAEVFGPVNEGSFFERSSKQLELEMIVFDEQRPPQIDAWHTDMTFASVPPAGSVVQIVELPPAGGNTCWVSTTKAYDMLSPALQAYFAGLQTLNTWELGGFREIVGARGENAVLEAMRRYPPTRHPLVLTHPESGKRSLYFNRETARRVEGVDEREGKGMLDFLGQWVQRPEFMIHHRWDAHGIAVWDNRTTQHYALADYWPHRRVNQRITFGGPLQAPQERPARLSDARESASA